LRSRAAGAELEVVGRGERKRKKGTKSQKRLPAEADERGSEAGEREEAKQSRWEERRFPIIVEVPSFYSFWKLV
jgi:hypothetical protein